MKHEYHEGAEALERFNKIAKEVFRVPKSNVKSPARPAKKAAKSRKAFNCTGRYTTVAAGMVLWPRFPRPCRLSVRKGFALHCLTDTVKHVPCGLLGDPNVPRQLIARHSVFAVGNHPNCHHPLIQAERRVFKYGSNLEAELLLASIALPDAASLDEGMPLRPTTGASHLAVREPQVESVLESTVGIGEEDDCLLKCMRGLHIDNVPRFFACVKYVISEIAVLKKALEHECEIAVALTFGRGTDWKMEYETTIGWARCEVAKEITERKKA